MKLSFYWICLLSLGILVFTTQLRAQPAVLDNNPPSIRWQRIDTDGFRVIFPKGLEHEGQRMANTLQHIQEPQSKTLGTTPKKVNIILQNQNSISNGFVALGPRRSEFFTTPPQNFQFLGTNDWLNLLAVHEYRHIVQFHNSKRGFNKFFYYLFGQNTQAGMAQSAVPRWFWEGDATAIETAFSKSGRGRIPDFTRVFRSNVLEYDFSYNKRHLRSFKHFVPDHYRLGYHFVSHLRKKTQDPHIFEKVNSRAFSWPFIPFTFSNALKKETGKHLLTHYDELMKELSETWTKQIEGLPISGFSVTNKRRNKAFTNYQFPQPLPYGRVLVLKSGIGDIQQLISIDAEGNEVKEFVPGILVGSAMLSTAGSLVAWNEFEYDPRWRIKSYSVIKTYNMATGKLRRVTKKSRYAGAALSPHGKMIATIETTLAGENKLVVVNATDGRVLKTFDNPNNDLIITPRWTEDGKGIVVVQVDDKEGKSLMRYDYENGQAIELLKVGQENIGHPYVSGNYILFNSPYSGIDNVHALDLATKKRYQVTSSKYGAYNASVSEDQKTIYYNNHQKLGLDVVNIPFDPASWTPIEAVEDRDTRYYATVVEQEGHTHILDHVPDKQYKVSNYGRFRGIFNPHSWGPFVGTDLIEAQAGIFSQNVLSTTSSYLGYAYNFDEENGQAVARVSYQGLFPIIDFEYRWASRTSNNSFNDQEGNRRIAKLDWQESTFSTGLRVPIRLTNSKYFREFIVSNYLDLTTVSNFENSTGDPGRFVITDPDNNTGTIFLGELDNGELLINRARFAIFNQLKRAQRDINSKWGQSISADWRSTPFGGDFDAAQVAVRGTAFFPGLFKHHSTFIRGAYQYNRNDLQDRNDNYRLTNRIVKPRGYSYPFDERFYTLSGNYALPLLYPDLALGPLLNVQRVKANLFYDYGRGELDFIDVIDNREVTRSTNYNSYGAEVTFDFNVLRFPALLEMGFRFGYLNELNETFFELVIGSVAF